MGGRRSCRSGGEDDSEGGPKQGVFQGAEQESWGEGDGGGLHLRGNRANSGSHQGGWPVASYQRPPSASPTAKKVSLKASESGFS